MRARSVKRAASDSAPQREAEARALDRIAGKLGVPRLLPNQRIAVGKSSVWVDGIYEDPARVVMVEVNAHVGPMKTAQCNKVLKDAYKMLVVSKLKVPEWHKKQVKCILVFVDKAARDTFGPRTWASEAFRVTGITTEVCECGETERATLLAAQRRQDLRADA